MSFDRNAKILKVSEEYKQKRLQSLCTKIYFTLADYANQKLLSDQPSKNSLPPLVGSNLDDLFRDIQANKGQCYTKAKAKGSLALATALEINKVALVSKDSNDEAGWRKNIKDILEKAKSYNEELIKKYEKVYTFKSELRTLLESLIHMIDKATMMAIYLIRVSGSWKEQHHIAPHSMHLKNRIGVAAKATGIAVGGVVGGSTLIVLGVVGVGIGMASLNASDIVEGSVATAIGGGALIAVALDKASDMLSKGDVFTCKVDIPGEWVEGLVNEQGNVTVENPSFTNKHGAIFYIIEGRDPFEVFTKGTDHLLGFQSETRVRLNPHGHVFFTDTFAKAVEFSQLRIDGATYDYIAGWRRHHVWSDNELQAVHAAYLNLPERLNKNALPAALQQNNNTSFIVAPGGPSLLYFASAPEEEEKKEDDVHPVNNDLFHHGYCPRVPGGT